MEFHAQDPHDDRSEVEESICFALQDVTPLDERCRGTYEGTAPCPKCKTWLTCRTYSKLRYSEWYLDTLAVVVCGCGAQLRADELIDHDGDEHYAYCEFWVIK